MWLFGGIITLSKVWVNIAAAKNATAPQRLLTDIDEVVLYWRRDCKNAAWTYPMSGAVFHVQFPGAGDDVLRLFSGIGVPAEPFPGFNLIPDR